MAERVKITYGDVAPEAKENFVASVNNKADFVDLSDLQQYNLRVGNYANPCELYQTILDGSQEVFPEFPAIEKMGLWSNSISGADGRFAQPVVLTLESAGLYSTKGMTFTFDTNNKIFPQFINIKWYRDGELLKDESGADLDVDFQSNSDFYFCEKKVEDFNKLVITFDNLNLPYNRLKLRAIDYGFGTIFYADELKNVKLIQEVDPLSESIVINTCDFTLNSKSDFNYSFSTKQPLSVYFNGDLKAVVFVESSKRKSKNVWNVKAEDYVGILDGITFIGGMYTEKNAAELIDTILRGANVPFTIAENLLEEKVTGYIPICSCRKALQKICFAIGAVADTSNSDTLNIFKLPAELSQVIPKTRIAQGQSVDERERVTEVQLVQHSYVPIEDDSKRTVLYDSNKSGTGERILVEFSEPMHSLTVINGEVNPEECGANFAILTARENCLLRGKPYQHNQRIVSKKVERLSTTEIEKIESIKDETLVSAENVDRLLDLCYDYYTKKTTFEMSIIDGKNRVKYGQAKYGSSKYGEYIPDMPVNVGDIIQAETEYLGVAEGRIVSATFNLDGNIIVKECEMV